MITPVFRIEFDFTSTAQSQILQHLQNNGYILMGFRGAKGPMQVHTGLPAWFAIPYFEMFGNIEIDYEPLYKVFVFNNQSNLGSNSLIQMQALSTEVPLGTSMDFNSDATFSTKGPSANPETISIFNARPGGTNNITVGLAAKVNGVYSPFCAFTLPPQAATTIEPTEKICLYAAQTDKVSGSIIEHAENSGCTFEFNSY